MAIRGSREIGKDAPHRLLARYPHRRFQKHCRDQIGSLCAGKLLGAQPGNQLEEPVLRLPYPHHIKYPGVWRGVGNGRSAGNNDWVSDPAVTRVQRDSRKIKDGQDICGGQFVANGECQHIEFHDRSSRLERVQRRTGGSEQRFVIESNREDTFACHAIEGVESGVQDSHGIVCHAYFVQVRETQRNTQVRVVFDGRSVFTAQVTRRLLYPGKFRLEDMTGVDSLHELYFLAPMPREMPTPMQMAQSDEPPYERKSSGMPVIGMTPMAMPALIMKWKSSMPNMPATKDVQETERRLRIEKIKRIRI